MRLITLASWFIGARFLGREAPLQTVLFINNKCNLACKHCCIYGKDAPITKSFEQIREELGYSFKLGSRFVDLEGGEPTLWRDAQGRDLNSVIALAREIGFYSVTVTTNAQLPFSDCRADSIWVSLDGLGSYHDQIRGPGAFERLERNIASCGHKRLSVNMVVNRLNYESVSETIEYASQSPYIRSISINFHTPYQGTEDLFLDWDKRREVIDKVIEYKKRGFAIMNSISGLRLMKGTEFLKRCWVTNFIMVNGDRLKECQGRRAGVCGSCGFSMAGEMNSVFSFKLDTILAGLKLRIGGKPRPSVSS